jgi:LysR family transcriptional regulator, flagellar master operon regulator
VAGAPEFLYPAYAVYAANADMKVLEPALAGLRHAAKGGKGRLTPPTAPSARPAAGRRAR